MSKVRSTRRAPRPKPVRVSEILRHNTAIVPASQLKAIKKWQQTANDMPSGSTLLVLPIGNGHLRKVARRLKVSFDAQGQTLKVTTIH